MQYINITLDILNRFSSTKRAKELLAVAIWIKMQHSKGVMWNVTSSFLRKRFHIGKAKADRLIEDMNGSDMFTVDSNRVAVATFRDHTVKYTRKGKAYRGAMVCRFAVAEYTLKDLYNLINEKLFEFQICAAEHKDCLLNDKDKPTGARGKAITISQFKKATNMSSGSVSRLKKRLCVASAVSSTLAETRMFDIRNINEVFGTLERAGKKKADFVYGDYGFIILPCRYSVADRNVSDGFRYLIYGRQTRKSLSRGDNAFGTPDGFYA